MRLRRSIVFSMGTGYDSLRAELARQIADIDCDSLCIDLEDGVVPSRKAEMRRAAARLLRELDFRGKEKIVRINELGSIYAEDDLEEILPALPDALRIPKCEHPEDILALDKRLCAFEKEQGLETTAIELILMIETPLGIRNVYELASCCDRVTAVGIGMEDLTSDMKMQRYYDDPFSDDLIYARQKFVLDVKAAGKQVIDSMSWWPMPEKEYMQYQRDYASRSYRMGYDGKSCRDVRDALIANDVYRPSPEQVEWGRKVVEAYERSERDGTIPVVDGKNICTARYNKGKWFKEFDEAVNRRDRERARRIQAPEDPSGRMTDR